MFYSPVTPLPGVEARIWYHIRVQKHGDVPLFYLRVYFSMQKHWYISFLVKVAYSFEYDCVQCCYYESPFTFVWYKKMNLSKVERKNGQKKNNKAKSPWFHTRMWCNWRICLRRSVSGSGSKYPVLKGLLHEIFVLWFFALINST